MSAQCGYWSFVLLCVPSEGVNVSSTLISVTVFLNPRNRPHLSNLLNSHLLCDLLLSKCLCAIKTSVTWKYPFPHPLELKTMCRNSQLNAIADNSRKMSWF